MSSDDNSHILIVDDEEPLLNSYAAILDRQYDVETASTGEAALDTIGEHTDVVLLDRRMPEYSGEQLLEQIRDRDFDCQILFCSAVVPDVDIIELEPDGYLHKPVGTDELIDEIDTQLRIAEQPDPVREYLELARLKSTLDAENSPTHLQSKLAYQQLENRIERRTAALDQSSHSVPTA